MDAIPLPPPKDRDAAPGAFRVSHPVWLMRRSVQLQGVARDAPGEVPDAARARELSALADAIGRELLGEGPARVTAEQAHLARVEERLLVERAEALLALTGRTPEDTRRADEWLAFARVFRELHAVIAGRLAVAGESSRPEGTDAGTDEGDGDPADRGGGDAA